MNETQAKIGLIGGTGFYDFFEGDAVKKEIRTEFGHPSDKITIGTLFGKKIAFLARHGKGHKLPPHRINYRANIDALAQLGVEQIIAPTAVGSLKTEIKPGDFVICDQFIDKTKKRQDSFFDGPQVAHIAMAYPYCSQLREIAYEQASKLDLPIHQKGTVVIIEGPKFSTLSESLYYSQMADLINMTQFPEVVLAAEKGICYLNISLVTDYDAGVYSQEGDSSSPSFSSEKLGLDKPVSIEEVLVNFKKNTEKLKKLVAEIIKNMPNERVCECQKRAEQAKI